MCNDIDLGRVDQVLARPRVVRAAFRAGLAVFRRVLARFAIHSLLAR
jgi:hypothetical protein